MPLELESMNEIEFMLYLLPALNQVDFRIPDKDLSNLKQNQDFLKFLYNLFDEQEKAAKKPWKPVVD